MAFEKCPKCGHAPLPRDQALPAACPACGLILAKFGAPPPPLPTAGESEDEPSARETIASRLFEVPAELSRPAWQARAAGLGVFVAWTLWIFAGVDIRDGSSGSWILHSVLLPFHEAGHYFIFRWFGPFIMTLGGTLGQHLLPIVMGWSLLFRHRDPFGATFCLWLLGYSTIDMAVYMYDAFDPKLMLLGGGTGAETDGHDWQNLFGDMGLLRRARGIGLFFGVLGMAMMVAALAWAAQWLRIARGRVDASLDGVKLP